MKSGITILPSDASISPAELARAAEERGSESLRLPEHSQTPVSRRTPEKGEELLPLLDRYAELARSTG